MKNTITYEEQQLMSLYNSTGTRKGLIASLVEMRGYLDADENELMELTDSAIAKLRAMTDEDEVMFTLRAEKLPELTECIRGISMFGMGYQGLQMDMPMNFPRPEFYNVMFEKWGLETGEVWRK